VWLFWGDSPKETRFIFDLNKKKKKKFLPAPEMKKKKKKKSLF